MASVKLVGNKQRISKSGKIGLRLRVTIDRKITYIPLDIAWPAAYFDNDAGSILPTSKKDADHSDYEIIINSGISKVNEIFKLYRISDRVLTKEAFEKEYQSFDNRKDFLIFLEKEIEKRYNEKDIEHQTYKNHKSILNKLRRFKKEIYFFEIRAELFTKYSRYLITKEENQPNTVWGDIKVFKTYLARAKKAGIYVDPDYLNYSSGKTTSRLVYLEDDELNKLIKLFNEEKLLPTQQQALRAFLFQCFTSLRISDVFKANWNWLNKKEELYFLPHKTQKFKRYITVPVIKKAKDLIQNPRGLFFQLPSEQEINRSLKEIAEKCDIYKNLTTHVGRHTFGTLFYRHTKDVVTLSKIMGHTKIEQTMVYVHINDQDKNLGMAKYEKALAQLK